MSIWEKGGKHYKSLKLKVSCKLVIDNLLFAEGNVIKYVCRHRNKNGKEDIQKAIHYLEMIIERDYD